MSVFSIGKNELKQMEEQAKKLETELSKKTNSKATNVSSLVEIILKEKAKIQNKLAVLGHQSPTLDPEDDDGIA